MKKKHTKNELQSVNQLRESLYLKELQALVILLAVNSLFAGFLINHVWWLPYHDLIWLTQVLFLIGIMSSARAIMYLPEYVEASCCKEDSAEAKQIFEKLEEQQNKRAFTPLFCFISGILIICVKIIMLTA